jgi:hypothetical protein
LGNHKEWYEAVQSGEFCRICEGYMGPGEGVPRTCTSCEKSQKNNLEQTKKGEGK